MTIAVFASLLILLGAAALIRGGSGNQYAKELQGARVEKDALLEGSLIMQDRPNNCGSAALKMVMDYRGLRVSLRHLEREMQFSSKGVSMLALKEAAAKYGLEAGGWNLTWSDLEHVSLPAIVFLRENHFAVLDSVSRAGFACLRDPSTGMQRIRKEKFMERWSGETLVFARRLSVDAEMREQPQKETK